jgi:hypothetical protein
MRASALNLLPSNRDDDGVFRRSGALPGSHPHGDLVYSVEVKDVAGRTADSVVAQAATPGTAWGAYYAAMRDYPRAAVTLRHLGAIIASTGDRH